MTRTFSGVHQLRMLRVSSNLEESPSGSSGSMGREYGVVIDSASEVAAATGVPGGRGIFVAVARLLQAVDGLSKSYDDLNLVLPKLEGFLSRLEGHLTVQAINQPLRDLSVRTLVQLMKIIALFVKFLDEEKAKSWFYRVIIRRFKDYRNIVFGTSGVQDALKELDNLLNEETLTTVARTLDVVTTVLRPVPCQLVDVRTDLLVDQQRTTELRRWLKAPDACTNHEDRSGTGSKIPGHADWFLNGDKFQQWLSQERGFYWVWARPGVGKSVLWQATTLSGTSAVIDYLANHISDRNAALAYFYFDYSDADKRTFLGLLASLVDALGLQQERAMAGARDIVSQAQKPGSSRAKISELKAILLRILATKGTRYIVIDALDECIDSPEYVLLPFLQEMVNSGGLGDVRIFVTSRREPGIKGFFATHNLCTHRQSLHTEEHRETLRRFILLELDKPIYGPSRLCWSDELRAEVAQTLLKKSDDMFLWVYLQLQVLQWSTPSQVPQVLADLPSDLSSTYERILSRYPLNLSTALRRVFECMLVSTEPLPWKAVAEMFLLNLRMVEPSGGLIPLISYSHSPNEMDPAILDHLPLVKRVPRYFHGKRKDVIVFIHFTVQEYLLSPTDLVPMPTPALAGQSSKKPGPFYHTDRLEALSTMIIVLLSSIEPSNAPSLRHLSRYADKIWYQVAADLAAYSNTTIPALSTFLSFDSASFNAWAQRFWGDKNAIDSPLHWAARIGLSQVVEVITRSHPDSHKDLDPIGLPPIFYAILRGSIASYTILLNCGYDWEHLYHSERGPNGPSATTILHLMADPNSPRLAAVSKSYAPNAHYDAMWPDIQSPAYSSKYHSMWELVLQRLSVASDLLAMRDGSGNTPLLRLASNEKCFPQTMRLLLDAGADADVSNDLQMTALHLVMSRSSPPDDFIRHLLHSQTQINASDSKGDTPLFYLVRSLTATLGTMRLLLDAGADPTISNHLRETILHVIPEQQEALISSVELLLSRGALLNNVNLLGRTPLHIMCSSFMRAYEPPTFRRTCERLAWAVKLLIEAGADPEIRDNAGKTPDVQGPLLFYIRYTPPREIVPPAARVVTSHCDEGSCL
ncbi:ankyrin [Clavulina sp. PMI_390]|nr:ankyrin [Clavulina sp. PMI_390]